MPNTNIQLPAVPPGTDPQLVVLLQPLFDAVLNLSVQVAAKTGYTGNIVIGSVTLVVQDGLITSVY